MVYFLWNVESNALYSCGCSVVVAVFHKNVKSFFVFEDIGLKLITLIQILTPAQGSRWLVKATPPWDKA